MGSNVSEFENSQEGDEERFMKSCYLRISIRAWISSILLFGVLGCEGSSDVGEQLKGQDIALVAKRDRSVSFYVLSEGKVEEVGDPLSVGNRPVDNGFGGNRSMGVTAQLDFGLAMTIDWRTGDINALDLSGDAPVIASTINIGKPPFSTMAISSDRSFVLTMNPREGTVRVLSLFGGIPFGGGPFRDRSLVEIGTVEVGVHPVSLAVSPNNDFALVVNAEEGRDEGTVSVIDRLKDVPIVRETVSVGFRPDDIAITPSGEWAFVPNRGDSTVSVLNLSGEPFVHEGIVDVGAAPVAVDVTPGGDRALVVNRRDDTVNVLDLRGDFPTVVGTLEVCKKPEFIDISPNTEMALAVCPGARMISVIDLSNGEATVVDSIETGSIPSSLAIGFLPPSVTFVDPFGAKNI